MYKYLPCFVQRSFNDFKQLELFVVAVAVAATVAVVVCVSGWCFLNIFPCLPWLIVMQFVCIVHDKQKGEPMQRHQVEPVSPQQQQKLRSALWKMLRQLQQQAKGSSSGSNSNDNNDNSNSNCPEIMWSKTENSKVIAHTHTDVVALAHTHVQANKQQIISRMKISFDIVFCASVQHSLLHLNDGNQSRRIKEIKRFWRALLL